MTKLKALRSMLTAENQLRSKEKQMLRDENLKKKKQLELHKKKVPDNSIIN